MRFPFRPWGSRRSDEAPRAGRARPTPDPEVVAKPKRRQFSAEYRLRVLEEADRCTQPGEVGRLLRREGLYSSHLTAWRKARRKGSLRELVGREEARRETGRTQPAGCEGARARGASGSPGARVAHRAHDPGRAGKSCRAAGIEPRTRNALLIAVQPLAAQVGVAPACQALGVSRATFYRRQRSTPGTGSPVQRPPGHCVKPSASRSRCARRPALRRPCAGGGVATLLDEGHYLCSERTMYRILAADQPVRERRNQREHPQYTKPELVATAPNQTWSWDITKLLGPTKWTYFYLYVVLDIFSRAVGSQTGRTRRWPVVSSKRPATNRASSPRCSPCTPTAAPMTSKCTAQLLADLGVTRSLSRPQVSDDNPFCAVQDPEVPPRLPWPLPRLHRRVAFCRTFFPWYNTEHRHGGRDARPGRRASQSNP